MLNKSNDSIWVLFWTFYPYFTRSMNVCMRVCRAFQVALVVKNLPPNGGDVGLIPGLRRSLEEGTAIHSGIPTWRISWTEEPGGLWSIGLQRVGHDWSDLARKHMRVCNKVSVSILSGFLLVSVDMNFYHKWLWNLTNVLF